MLRKLITTSFFFFILAASGSSQTDSTDEIFTFRITDYMLPLADSITLVQFSIPDIWPVRVRLKQPGILKKRYESEQVFDTAISGSGRCSMIKENWYYFSIFEKNGYKPKQGDLLITQCKVYSDYKGLFYHLLRFGISLTSVQENQFFNSGEVFSFGDVKEKAILDSMITDIKYTASAMLEQGDDQNFEISKGPFKGKKIFSLMSEAEKSDLESFIKYIIARPSKYAGNSWKISEIFATWAFEGAPMVIEKNK